MSRFLDDLLCVFLFFLVTLPEPVCLFKGENMRKLLAERAFCLALGLGLFFLVLLTERLLTGVLTDDAFQPFDLVFFLLDFGLINPDATTDIPVFNACLPALAKSGVAVRHNPFIRLPIPCPL